MFNAAVLPSKESSGFRQHKPAAWFYFGIFILIAVLSGTFSTKAYAVQVKVTFTPSSDLRVVGHNFYYCQSENMSKNTYSKKIDLGSDNFYVTPSLQEGETYYFAATAYDKYGNESVLSDVVSYKVSKNNLPISRNNWSMVYVDSEELVGENGRGVNAFDGNSGTIWHTQWKDSSPKHPHEIQIDMGAVYELESFRYLPRQDGSANGRIKDYAFYVSNDPKNWGNAAASGTFANSAAEKTITLNTPATGRFIRLVALNEVNGNPWTSAAEINVTGTASEVFLPPVGVIDTPIGNVTITKGESLSFSGNGADPKNLNLTYLWNFGDPDIPDTTLQNPGKVQFNNAGSYTVTFTVTNSKGMSGSANRTIIVTNPTTPNPSVPTLIPQTNWSLVYADSEELVGENGRGVNAFDGNARTFWHTQWKNNSPKHPHEIQIDLGTTYELESFIYLPRQDGSANGRIKDYAFYVSNDPKNWGNAVASGTFANSATEKTVPLNTSPIGRFIRLVALNEVNGNPWTSAAEINVSGKLQITPPSTLIPRTNWRLVYVDSEELVGENGGGTNAFDGKANTIWHTQWKNNSPKHPHEIQIDLGTTYELESFIYLPRQDGSANGRIKDYAFYVSNDPKNWGNAVASGTFANSATEKTVILNTPATGRFIRLVAINEVNGNPWTSAAEINLSGKLQITTPPTLIPRTNWNLMYVDSEELVGENGRGVNAFDGNARTFWHTQWKNNSPKHPHEIQIDLGTTYELESFIYLPRQDGSANGRIKDYAFYVSNDPKNWGNAVASGTFANSATEKTVKLNTPATGQFIRLVALNEVNGNPWTSVAEINVTGTVFINNGTLSSEASLLEANNDSSPQIIEWGEVFVDHNWQRVDFVKTFIHPIVVAKPASLNDPEPAVVRIRNVDENGFDIRIQEWDYQDGIHGFENVSYIVVEKGSYILPGGILLEAGSFNANGQNFLFNPFVDSFNQTPVVLASVTSENQQQAIEGRIKNVSKSGFEYILQEQELTQQQHSTETVSFIAIEPFSGVLNGLAIQVGTGYGVTNDFYQINFIDGFLTVPNFIADMQTSNDLAASNIRFRNKDLYGVEVHISTEQLKDTELEEKSENIGYIIIAE